MTDAPRFYDMGLEPVADVDGWAVFTGCDGEQAHFQAFVRDEADGLGIIERLRAEDNSDMQCVVAVLTSDMGIVAASDFRLTTHAELRKRIDEARAKGITL